jgi:hypothetical protein
VKDQNIENYEVGNDLKRSEKLGNTLDMYTIVWKTHR